MRGRRRSHGSLRDQRLLRHYNLLRRAENRAANPHAIIAALDLQLGNPGFRRQGDQLSDLINGHQWFSLTEVKVWFNAPDLSSRSRIPRVSAIRASIPAIDVEDSSDAET